MALVLADRVRETTSSTGTTAVTLGGAYTGFQTFLAGIGNSNSTYYTISDSITGQWEVGIGTYTSSGNTLSRDTVLSSSNSGSLVSFTAGTKDVFVTQPSERNVYVVGSNVVAENSATVPNSLLANSTLTLGATTLTLGVTTTSVASLTLTSAAVNGTLGATTPSTVAATSVTASLDSAFTSTGALTIPVGTTGQQPTGANGKIRYNSTLSQYEGYNSASATWALLGGAVVSNDTSTASNVYPIFAAATSGNISTVYTSNAKLLYKPSTGEFQASTPVASNGIVVNSLTVATSYTIAAGFSGASAGPITIASGQSVTVAGGSRWVIS
jgi:hypothetical protein